MAKWKITYKKTDLPLIKQFPEINKFLDKLEIDKDLREKIHDELLDATDRGEIPSSIKWIELPTKTPIKKGPKDIKSKTVDETAASFEELEKPIIPKETGPISTNEYPNMGKESGPGYAKPKSYTQEKKIKAMKLPEAKTKLKSAGDRLNNFGKEFTQKIQDKKKDFQKVYGGALDNALKDMKGGVPLDSEIPWNPDYVKDSLNKSKATLDKAGKRIAEGLQEKSIYADLLNERLKDAAPVIPKLTKPKPEVVPDHFATEIPGRLEPPPIPKHIADEYSRRKSLYDPKTWKEFAKEQPIPLEPNWRMYEAPKQLPAPTPKITEFKTMLDDLQKNGENPLSILKESATDAAKFLKKNKFSRAEAFKTIGNSLPWITLGLVAYELLHGNHDKAIEMAVENSIPIPGMDLGDSLEGPPIENPPARTSIFDYANLSRGLQG